LTGHRSIIDPTAPSVMRAGFAVAAIADQQ
jgi:hypothetical protein